MAAAAACRWLWGGDTFLSSAAVSDESSYLSAVFPSRRGERSSSPRCTLCARGGVRSMPVFSKHALSWLFSGVASSQGDLLSFPVCYVWFKLDSISLSVLLKVRYQQGKGCHCQVENLRRCRFSLLCLNDFYVYWL